MQQNAGHRRWQSGALLDQWLQKKKTYLRLYQDHLSRARSGRGRVQVGGGRPSIAGVASTSKIKKIQGTCIASIFHWSCFPSLSVLSENTCNLAILKYTLMPRPVPACLSLREVSHANVCSGFPNVMHWKKIEKLNAAKRQNAWFMHSLH